MRFARIDNGKVVEIVDVDGIEGRYHPDLVFVECQADVIEGWTYDGKTFSAPTPTAEDTAAMAQAVLAASDAGMARAVEDVIDRQDALDAILQAVIDKSAIARPELPGAGRVPDLPQAVRDNKAARSAARGNLKS